MKEPNTETLLELQCPAQVMSSTATATASLPARYATTPLTNVVYDWQATNGQSGTGTTANLTGLTPGNVQVQYTACYDPLDSIANRQESLLEMRFGYGRAATGGQQLCTVTNTNDSGAGSLRACLTTPNAWVVYDPSLNNSVIRLNSPIDPAVNTTLDGRDALVRIAANEAVLTQGTLFRYRFGNGIMHCVWIQLDSDVSGFPSADRYAAIRFLTGQDYWVDHVLVMHFDDEGVSVGNISNESAINVTVSYYKADQTNKGVLAFMRWPETQPDRNCCVTVACSDFAANIRNPRNSGGKGLHFFNNYVHDFGGDGGGTVTDNGDNGGGTATALVESSVFNDGNVGLNAQPNLSGTPSFIFTDGDNLFLGGSGSSGEIIGPNDPDPPECPRPVIPYDYQLLPVDSVQSHVLANAGVDGENKARDEVCRMSTCVIAVVTVMDAEYSFFYNGVLLQQGASTTLSANLLPDGFGLVTAVCVDGDGNTETFERLICKGDGAPGDTIELIPT